MAYVHSSALSTFHLATTASTDPDISVTLQNSYRNYALGYLQFNDDDIHMLGSNWHHYSMVGRFGISLINIEQVSS